MPPFTSCKFRIPIEFPGTGSEPPWGRHATFTVLAGNLPVRNDINSERHLKHPTMSTRPDPQKIQRVEYCDLSNVDVYCPFCGQHVVPAVDTESVELAPCKHTLFIAHDEGFEARCPLFDRLMEVEGVESDDIDMADEGIDGYTDTFPDPLAVKFAFYAPAPSQFGLYVAFHPFAQPPEE